MKNLGNLIKDLEYFEGLLHAYDGDGKEGKEVRETLRARITEIRTNLEPFKAIENSNDAKTPINGKALIDGKKPSNDKAPISGNHVTLETTDDVAEVVEDQPIYSQESA